MTEIQSRQNTAFRHLARLGREKKYRKSTGEMLCEGEKMLHEALDAGAQIKTVLVRGGGADAASGALLARAEQAGAALYCAPEALFTAASDVETPQNVIFSCVQPQWDAAALDGKEQVLLLDGLQDPGNLGTILRTAEAFALGAVVLCEGCADPFSPKVVRATMGAVFRLPCVSLPLERAMERLRAGGLSIYATALHGDSVPLGSVGLKKAAVIIGSEGRGVSQQALAGADKRVVIPMAGRAESLNAGVAAAIVIYEMTK
ncbi:MAG: RNA methyltransferase [Eubacteriales bacterium]|nr:RNA methyltransferase [Eubacteriales bacterium]